MGLRGWLLLGWLSRGSCSNCLVERGKGVAGQSSDIRWVVPAVAAVLCCGGGARRRVFFCSGRSVFKPNPVKP
jgi:hypothetical protein